MTTTTQTQTKWITLTRPTSLRAKHDRMVAALRAAGVDIGDVEVLTRDDCDARGRGETPGCHITMHQATLDAILDTGPERAGLDDAAWMAHFSASVRGT